MLGWAIVVVGFGGLLAMAGRDPMHAVVMGGAIHLGFAAIFVARGRSWGTAGAIVGCVFVLTLIVRIVGAGARPSVLGSAPRLKWIVMGTLANPPLAMFVFYLIAILMTRRR